MQMILGSTETGKGYFLIREEGMVKTKHYLDVTSDKIFESPWYLLKSNDIVYVEPLKTKEVGYEYDSL